MIKELIAIAKTNYTVARVKTYTASSVGKAERHNERKNESYANMNVELSRSSMNVHFKDCGDLTYNQTLQQKLDAGELSLRGLRQDAKIFDEMIVDVNTQYFEERGGYAFAKRFYEEAYRFAAEEYGEANILSAVMHADELNKALTEKYGYPVYHYHMHVMAIPVVEKQVLWSKRCKDKALVGTVKETVLQISHSKKWKSEKKLDEKGKPVLRADGKPQLVPSYSLLQDRFYEHMSGAGFSDFIRGERGSTAEHLTTLEYQIQKDRERLDEIKQQAKDAEHDFIFAKEVAKTLEEIDGIGKLNRLTGNYTLSKSEYDEVTALAKEGVTGRTLIADLSRSKEAYRRDAEYYEGSYEDLKRKYNTLKEKCKPFLDALEHFPEVVQKFVETIRDLFTKREAEEKAARERLQAEREKAKQERKMKIRRGGRER